MYMEDIGLIMTIIFFFLCAAGPRNEDYANRRYTDWRDEEEQ